MKALNGLVADYTFCKNMPLRLDDKDDKHIKIGKEDCLKKRLYVCEEFSDFFSSNQEYKAII